MTQGKKSRVRATPKGRRVDPKAREDVAALLGDAPRRRDLLIEHLHKIQDRFGCLSAAHLVALAAEMKLAMTEVCEVATFYHHFDVVKGRHARRRRSRYASAIQSPANLAGSQKLLEKLLSSSAPACACCTRPASAAARRLPSPWSDKPGAKRDA
jgi:formate dehydrogenase